MSCYQKKCYFCQVFAAKIGSGRSLPCKGCHRCVARRKNCRVTLVKKCPAPIQSCCPNRCQEGTFASDWAYFF